MIKSIFSTCKVYDPEAQPWLMRVGGKGGRKYKVRNLSISDIGKYIHFCISRAFVRAVCRTTQHFMCSHMARMGPLRLSPSKIGLFHGINGSCVHPECQVQLHSNTEVQDPGC